MRKGLLFPSGYMLACLIMLLTTLILPYSQASTTKMINNDYIEPIYEKRLNSQWGFSIKNPGGEHLFFGPYLQTFDEVSELNLLEIRQGLFGNGYGNGNDWEESTCETYKIYIPTRADFSYRLILTCAYKCQDWVKYGGDTLVFQSYYYLEAFDSSDNSLGKSSNVYAIDFDNRPGMNKNVIPTVDNQYHQLGPSTLTLSGSNIKYIKIKIVVKGSFLCSNEGSEITFSKFDLTYPLLFCGNSWNTGDQYVNVGRSNLASCDIELTVKNGYPNGNDWGDISVKTPYLHFNNEKGLGLGHISIEYEVSYWNKVGQFVFRGILMAHYYDSTLSLLGTNSKDFIDYNSVSQPYSSIEPDTSPGWHAISISSGTNYEAKYVQVELLLEGSYLHSNNGLGIKFKDLKLAGGRSCCLEQLLYYESDYDNVNDLQADAWYTMNYYLNEVQGNRLYDFTTQIDDDVSTSDFIGSGNDDVDANDFFVHLGHGLDRGSPTYDTGVFLTNGNGVDDDQVGTWDNDLEFSCFFTCSMLKDYEYAEWGTNLYYAHCILGFEDEISWDSGDFKDFYVHMIEDEMTIADSFSLAYTSMSWREVWDDDSQYLCDHLWDIDPGVKTVTADEFPEDGISIMYGGS